MLLTKSIENYYLICGKSPENRCFKTFKK